MKYIRTKDGIYEINPKLTNEDIDISFGKDTPRADTIEKLCDVFVAIGEQGKIITFAEKENLKNYEYTMFPVQKLIEKYGAIHIKDKGLIYVAKMNEIGELELIWVKD